MTEKDTFLAGNELRRTVADRLRQLAAWLTLIGGLCGSINKKWNMLLPISSLRLARLLRLMGEIEDKARVKGH
jgi:hypothetical protein